MSETENTAIANATHTPGPWTIHPPVRGYAHSVMAKHTSGYNIACADVPQGLDADGIDSLANASLIAAAPDLLDALKAFCGDHEATGFECAGLNAAYRHALSVIAKAEGRQA